MSTEETRPAHELTNMPGRYCCTCGYGSEGPVRTLPGLHTHITRANSIDAGARAWRGSKGGAR